MSGTRTGPPVWRVRVATFVLAAVASATAVSISVLSGWQRGGLLAEQRTGEVRAATVRAVPAQASTRSLAVVMVDRTNVTRQLAFAQTQRCARDSGAWEAHRMILAARLNAPDAEGDEIRRRQATDNRVTWRLAALLDTTTARVDPLSRLAFASELEGIARLLWTITLRSSPAPAPVAVVLHQPSRPRASHGHQSCDSIGSNGIQLRLADRADHLAHHQA